MNDDASEKQEESTRKDWKQSAEHFSNSIKWVIANKLFNVLQRHEVIQERIDLFFNEVPELQWRKSTMVFVTMCYNSLKEYLADVASEVIWKICEKYKNIIEGKEIQNAKVSEKVWINCFEVITKQKLTRIHLSANILMKFTKPETEERKQKIEETVKKMLDERNLFQIGVNWIGFYKYEHLRKKFFNEIILKAHIWNFLNVLDQILLTEEDRIAHLQLLDEIVFKMRRKRAMTELETKLLKSVGNDKIIGTVSRQAKKNKLDIKAMDLYTYRCQVMNDIRHNHRVNREGFEEFVIQSLHDKNEEFHSEFLFTILRRNNFEEVICWGYYFGIPKSKMPYQVKDYWETYLPNAIAFKQRLDEKVASIILEDSSEKCVLFEKEYELYVICTSDGFKNFVEEFSKFPPSTVGIDCEAGSFATGTSNSVTVLQIATEHCLYIIDVFLLKDKVEDGLWMKFFETLFQPNILKVGFAFSSDFLFLIGGFPNILPLLLKEESKVLCVHYLVNAIMTDYEADKVVFKKVKVPKNINLADVSEAFLEITLDKSLQASNWTQRPLSDEQKIYAVTDALITLLVKQKIEKLLIEGLGQIEADKILDFAYIRHGIKIKGQESNSPSPMKKSATFTDVIQIVKTMNAQLKNDDSSFLEVDDVVLILDAPFFSLSGYLHNLGIDAVDIRFSSNINQKDQIKNLNQKEQMKKIEEKMKEIPKSILITTEKRANDFNGIEENRILIMPTTGDFVGLHYIYRIMKELKLYIDEKYFFTRCEKCSSKNLKKLPAPVYKFIYLSFLIVQKVSMHYSVTFDEIEKCIIELKEMKPEDYEGIKIKIKFFDSGKSIPDVFFIFDEFKIKPFHWTLIRTGNEQIIDNFASFIFKLSEKTYLASRSGINHLVCLDCGFIYHKVNSKEVEELVSVAKGTNLEADEDSLVIDSRSKICQLMKKIIPNVDFDDNDDDDNFSLH